MDLPAPDTSVEESIIAMLNAEKAPPPASPPPATPPTEEQEEEAGQNKQVEGEDAEDEAPVAEIPLDQLEAIQLEVTIKSDDGKDVTEKPTIKELKDGYMMKKDYSRKTADLARQRDEVGEKVRQAIDSERNSYATTLQQLHNVVLESVAPELKDVNWNHLASNDPAEYVRLRNRADQISQVLGQIKSKTEEATKKQEADRRQALIETAKKTRAQLEADIPGFNDDLYKSLMKTAENYGYKPEEVGNWVDPRAIKLLNDAHQFQDFKSKKPLIEKKVVNVPKVVKTGSVQQARKPETDALEKLHKSGTVDDAAAVILQRMNKRK